MASTHNTCVLDGQGSLYCFGFGGYGIPARGNTNAFGDTSGEMATITPVDIDTGFIVNDFDLRSTHACAVSTIGTIKCWGTNTYGQLGHGNTNHRGIAASQMGTNLPYTNLGTGMLAKQVACGDGFTCALLTDGRVKCWGLNNYGQLGYGDTATRGDGGGEMGDNLGFVDMGSGVFAQKVCTGTSFTCVLTTANEIKCWGRNAFGQLGIGNTNSIGDGGGEMGANLASVDFGQGSDTPFDVICGSDHTCALYP